MRKALLLLILVLAGCRTADPLPLLDRAIVTREHVESAIEAEKQFAASYETVAAPNEPWFEIRPGKTRVLLVAGHATAQTREGSLKVADRGTGALAVALHELTGASVIFTTKRSPSDPNYYDDNEFKAAIARLIREQRPIVVLDLHGSHSYRPYDVDFGTMAGKSLLDRNDLLVLLVKTIRGEGLINLSQDYFAAARQQTVTKFVSSRGVPAVQLEISATCLDPGRDPLSGHRFAQILQALARFIEGVTRAQGSGLRP